MRHTKLRMITTAAGPAFRPVAMASKCYEVPVELAAQWLALGYATEAGPKCQRRLKSDPLL